MKINVIFYFTDVYMKIKNKVIKNRHACLNKNDAFIHK